MTRLYVVWAWLFVALGLTLSILGPALPEWRAEFGLPLAAAGLVFVVHSLGYFGGVLLAGGLADAWGRKFVCGAGAALLTAAMALAAAAPSWGLLLAVIVLAGGGFALVDVGLNAAIGDAVPGAGNRAAAMNLLHAAFPAGTLAAPAGLALALRVGYGWRTAFAVAAMGAAVSLAGFGPGTARWPRASPLPAGLPSGESDAGDEAWAAEPAREARALAGPSRLLRLLREPYLRKLAALLGLYVGVEVGIAGWIATYLVEQFGASAAAGALGTSLYWGAFLVGRPAMAVVAHRFGPQRILPWLCLTGVAAAAGVVVAPSGAWAAAATAAAGLAICGIFPTTMALALEGRTHDAGAAAALAAGAASLGGLVWPWLIGAVAQAAGLRVGMATAAAPLLVMLPLAQRLGPQANPYNPCCRLRTVRTQIPNDPQEETRA